MAKASYYSRYRETMQVSGYFYSIGYQINDKFEIYLKNRSINGSDTKHWKGSRSHIINFSNIGIGYIF